ncbi:MAG: TIR domain-containing protein [Bacteroidetes bacterium]|nr:MAG: TIR domain-containing protein [Bacteroidota bacterium]
MAKWLDKLTGKERDPYDEALARIEKARKQKEKSLDLSSMGLSQLPPEIGNLKQLTQLVLYKNQLTVLPPEIGNLNQLSYLSFSNNQLTQLPHEIGNLTQLTYLDLSFNRLSSLPTRIGKLTLLKTLQLQNNQLYTLPQEICGLTQLNYLRLHTNQLSALPQEIGNLKELTHLYIDNNKLTSLPETIKELKNLRSLHLHGNEILAIPKEVLGSTWWEDSSEKGLGKPKDILDYYFRTRGGKRPLNEAKLILVGRGTVGKTSLVNRLLTNTFNEHENTTEGIKISGWGLKLNKKEDVRLNIWDFGGQEIMHATHQFFLTQRSLYLLVLNGREGGEDADAEYWLKLISSFGSDSPVIIVMNKIKQHQFDLNRRGLQQKYPNIKEFIKTDCEDGTGITELKQLIERETDRLEHLRDAFPASWFGIKEKLASMKENYLTFDAYRKYCSEEGEQDTDAQDALAGYLHNLGIALNYKDDRRLRDKHILNPLWLTTGIYKILNSGTLAKQHGVLTLDTISGVLDVNEYPRAMHNFLFDLMKKFELCFVYDDTKDEYLIPELLSKDEPAETQEFEPTECLNFQYQYPVLPEGLLPRFIVRTHILSEGLQRWRTGVILQFEGCKALVKADVQDKKVFISIKNNTAAHDTAHDFSRGLSADARRRLLAVIRSDFERIHGDIKNLQPQEMVPLPKDYKVVVPYRELRVMEEKNITSFSKVVGDDVMELDVQELLNGVDIEGSRPPLAGKKTLEGKEKRSKLFYSYSHKDEEMKNALETHLKLLQRQGLLETWNDRKIGAGEEWKGQIDENLEQADIILLLVSADFLASDYCYDIEMKRAMEKHEKKEAVVIPVIIRDVNWTKAPFGKLQALPKDGKPVTSFKPQDKAWKEISTGIENVVKKILDKKYREVGSRSS